MIFYHLKTIFWQLCHAVTLYVYVCDFPVLVVHFVICSFLTINHLETSLHSHLTDKSDKYVDFICLGWSDD